MAKRPARRPDRVLFPESGFTKDDAIDYYRRVSRVLLPHLKNVPVSFKRYPDTVNGPSYWEKDAPSFTPDWVRTVDVPRRTGDLPIRYVVVNDARTLVWLADAGAIEIHPFLHRTPHLDRATSVVFDLDPGPGAGLADCCEVALLLRDALAGVKLQSFAKVSGSKGLQLYVPLNGTATHEATEAFARLVADELARANPRHVVSRMAKQLRAGRVFIDWSQNAGYKTTVAVYSLRGKGERPLVSMPVTWREVEQAKPERLTFEPRAALARISRRGDLFAPVLRLRQRLPLSGAAAASRAPSRRREEEERPGAVVRGVRLPRPKSQSGRRLFAVVKTEQAGDELWLDVEGKFHRWILRPDRDRGRQLIALPAGQFPVDPAFFRGAVPAEWRTRVKIEDIGAYELIDGSEERQRFDLWFTGRTLEGEWVLEKIDPREEHRSWRLAPVR